MCSEVRRGLGFGGFGLTWCNESVELGPDERSSGYVGWNEREVIADWSKLAFASRELIHGTYRPSFGDILQSLNVDRTGL